MMHVGNVPGRYDIALDLKRLNRVIEHEPADLTITCEAGMTVGALREHLAEVGQSVPLDPSVAPAATVGGVLAAGASGPAGVTSGAPRDFTIGMKVVNADGRITKAGGKVVKNVAGYDLCKLYIGSFGTLGVIVEATFKLVPRPGNTLIRALGFAAPDEACAFVAEVHRRGLNLRAARLLNAGAAATESWATGGAYLLALDLAGSAAGVERSAAEITNLAHESGAFLFKDRSAGPAISTVAPSGLECRLCTLPTELPTLIAAIEDTGASARIDAAPLSGVVRAGWPDAAEADGILSGLSRLTSRGGFPMVIERCPLDLKRRVDVFGPLPSSFALMRRVKEQFDPARTLSPGRFLGGL